MGNIYEAIPVLESERFFLRAIDRPGDLGDLLKVYSDEKAVPLFNSDNCHGDDFHYQTEERMKAAIDFWAFSYEHGYFVRLSIEDKAAHTVVGTIELFHREAEDYFNRCGLLRLDLRSDYETEEQIVDILNIIVPRTKELFGSEMIATKAVPMAKQRIAALEQCGFQLSEHGLVGEDGTRYGSYYSRMLD